MSIEELVRGPGDANPPAMDKPWTVISGKNEGITPGLVIRDSKGRKYFLKFDPKTNPEMASAADVVGSKILLRSRLQRTRELHCEVHAKSAHGE